MKKTKFTTAYNKWDIILVPFPFTTLETTQKRPALIVSPDEYNKKADVVIAFITSKLDVEYKTGDYVIQEWKEAHLPKPSMLRMKFATIDKSIIIKKLGKLTDKDIVHYRELLVRFFTM